MQAVERLFSNDNECSTQVESFMSNEGERSQSEAKKQSLG